MHFGAGNIGRGFIGEILSQNGFEISFVDVNATIIDELNKHEGYTIEIANEGHEKIEVNNVRGINSEKNSDGVVAAIAEADIVTTAIGPNILPHIAELCAKGIQTRRVIKNKAPIDFIACENMIAGSEFLFKKIKEYLTEEDLTFVAEFIGFPNAAVDRIISNQKNERMLYVTVEPFREWVIDESQLKNENLKINGVYYTRKLESYIERKLFSVNSGHATVAYNGAYYGYKTILESLQHSEVLNALKAVQDETRTLLLARWDFKEEELIQYHKEIISRFTNPKISDEVTRVGRTPIRKLGYNERFIRPIRELEKYGESYVAHLDVVGKIFTYKDKNDAQAVELQERLVTSDLIALIKEITGLSNQKLLMEIGVVVKKYIK